MTSEKEINGFLEFKVQNPDLCQIMQPKNEIEINLNENNNFSIFVNMTLYGKRLGFTDLDVYFNGKKWAFFGQDERLAFTTY